MTSAINTDPRATNYAEPLEDDRSELNTPEPPPARRQPGQRVELHLEHEPEPLEVTIDNRDRIAFEKVQNKRGWPKAQDAQNLAMTFVCWSAAKRAGLTVLPYEAFEAALIDYDVLAEAPADPTR